VALINRHPALVTSKLLAAAATTPPDELSVTWTVGSIQSLRRASKLPSEWPYSGLTFEGLKLIEGRFFDASYQRTFRLFPEPPFVGIANLIDPVGTFERLLIETDEVGFNFLGVVEQIMAGNLCLYSLHDPERATILVRRDHAQDVWRLQPILSANDKGVSAQTTASVFRWFCAVSTATRQN
jgi:hypothetical protein